MAKQWVVGNAFEPAIGMTYEVAFGSIEYRGQRGHWSAQIHTTTSGVAGWIDLDTGEALDPQLSKYVVKAYRVLSIGTASPTEVEAWVQRSAANP